MSLLPKKNPEIKWEVPKGRDISNLVLTSGSPTDPQALFRLIPEHLKPIANKIKHLTKILEAEIRVYDRELSKCEVAEIRRIVEQEREAIQAKKRERWDKDKKKILKTYRGVDKVLSRRDGLTKPERFASEMEKFLEKFGDETPEDIKKKAQEFIKRVKL